MPEDAPGTQTAEPAGATAAATAEPGEGSPTAPPSRYSFEDGWGDFLTSNAADGQREAGTTDSDGGPAPKETTADTTVTAETAPTADVKPTETAPTSGDQDVEAKGADGKPRRQGAAERNEAEKAELRKAVETVMAERDAAKAELAKQTASDAELDTLQGTDVEFERRKNLMEEGKVWDLSDEEQAEYHRWRSVRRARGVLHQRVSAEAAQSLEAHKSQFWDTVLGEIGQEAQALPGVDTEKLGNSQSWREIARQFHAAGAASTRGELEPEIKKLRDQVSALTRDVEVARTQGIGSHRAPETGGRSGAQEPARSGRYDPTRSLSENFEEAFGDFAVTSRR